MSSKTGLIDGIRVVSTTELCARLGLPVTSTSIVKSKIGKPFCETSNGVYWREDDVPQIAINLAIGLMQIAAELSKLKRYEGDKL